MLIQQRTKTEMWKMISTACFGCGVPNIKFNRLDTTLLTGTKPCTFPIHPSRFCLTIWCPRKSNVIHVSLCVYICIYIYIYSYIDIHTQNHMSTKKYRYVHTKVAQRLEKNPGDSPPLAQLSPSNSFPNF